MINTLKWRLKMNENQISMLKGAVKSKTVWLNVLTLIVDYGAVLSGVVPPGALTAIVALANIGVRVLTTQSLAEKGAK
jgi:hypothetical protein